MTVHNDTTPRVRGKPWPCEGPRMPGRYNPACAGKTSRPSPSRGKRLIQPRVCGENFSLQQRKEHHPDTTPRVRGKHFLGVDTEHTSGYNPACAGKTRRTRRYSGKRQIQPRVCGENARSRLPSATRRDTTPRVRGKRGIRARHVSPFRYNPACAGKTRGEPRGRPACQIQPRVCGENFVCSACFGANHDTTPRVRGKRIREVNRDSAR